jgi:type I restriction enzyme S subunit
VIGKLGNFCQFLNGGTPSKEVSSYFEGEIPWITSADITGPIANTARSFITADAIQHSATNRVAKGTVLLVTRTGVGKVAIAGFDLCFSQDITAIRPDGSQLDSSYLVHFLRTKQGYFQRHARGATIKGVTRDAVTDLNIPLPPLPEQRRIAAILDQADALRAKRREALAQLDSLTQSIFIEMFGNNQTIYSKWPTKNLGEILEFLTSGSRGWAEYYANTGALFLRIQNVCRDQLKLDDVAFVNAPDSSEARRTEALEGDVLLSITADLGRTAVVPAGIGKAHINQHLSILRTKALAPRYLSAFLSSPAGQREILGRDKHGVKAGLNFNDIRSLRVPMPPEPLQRDFVLKANFIAKQKLAYQQSLYELDALFASLQHRAFRGEL